jgi:hypothetical protein
MGAIAGISGDVETSPTAKSNIIFSGSMNLISRTGDLYTNYTRLNLRSDALYLTKDNMAIGSVINYLNMDYSGIKGYSEFEAGPSFCYFFKKIGSSDSVVGSIYPFAQLSLLLSNGCTKDEKGNKTSQFGFKVPLSLGCVYMMSRTVGIFTSVFFSIDGSKNKEQDKMEKGIRYGIIFGFKLFKYKK